MTWRGGGRSGVRQHVPYPSLTPLPPRTDLLAVRSRFSPLCFSSVVKLSEDVPACGLWRPADGAPVSPAHQHRRASGAVWQEQWYSLPRGPQWVEHNVYVAQWATGKNITYQLASYQIRYTYSVNRCNLSLLKMLLYLVLPTSRETRTHEPFGIKWNVESSNDFKNNNVGQQIMLYPLVHRPLPYRHQYSCSPRFRHCEKRLQVSPISVYELYYWPVHLWDCGHPIIIK